MISPNLFDYATKELSQDAMICWLIDWVGADTTGASEEEKELRRCGRAFVDALFSKWRGWDYSIDLGDSVRTEVRRQDQSIDVLARLNGLHVLLIEDKTETGAHDNQLERYWESVVKGETSFGEVAEDNVWPIYCRTGNHSLKERRRAEEQEYAVFDRTDFLGVLKTYQGTNDILINFRRYLKRWQEETDSFREWTKDSDEKTKRSWEGLYRHIEENCLDNSGDDWGPLSSRVGGYNGLWIEPTETSQKSKFAIWIEEDRISFRLYGAKTRISKPGMNREKGYWACAFEEQRVSGLSRPSRLDATSTKPMCVAEWRDWLAFRDDGRLDLDGSVKNVSVAKEVLLRTIRGGSR